MSTTVGRYRDVARAPVPGELPAEGRIPIGYVERPRDLKKQPARDPRRPVQPSGYRMPDAITGIPIYAEGQQITHCAVADPNTSLRGKRQRAAVNVRTDALEREYANKRISDAAYMSAVTYRAVLEKSRRPVSAGGSWNPGNRVDQVHSQQQAMLNRVIAAQDAVAMLRDTAPTVGMRGQRVLELVLIDGLTLTEVAKRMTGGDDRQAVIYYSQLFRDSCEALADHWIRRDKRMPRAS